jgi:hypothetical protein
MFFFLFLLFFLSFGAWVWMENLRKVLEEGYKKELSTGLGADRESNMIAFAVEALTLLRDVVKGDAKV